MKQMKLVTKELEKKFKKIGYQGDTTDPIVIARFFSPFSGYRYYATEYDKESNTVFGFATGLGFPEWGKASINELESVRFGGLVPAIERDVLFKPMKFSDCKKEYADLKGAEED